MNSTSPGSLRSRLSVRFAIILAVTLTPMALIALIKTNDLENEVRARSEAALLGTTLRAAESETGLILRMRGLVAGLAQALPEVVDDPQACTRLMQNVARQEPAALVVAFVPVDGLMTCVSTGQPHDFAGGPLLARMNASRTASFVINQTGPISGVSILGLSDPVHDLSGAFIGTAGISLSHQMLQGLQAASIMPENWPVLPVTLWTFDRDGTVLGSNIGLSLVEPHLPKGAPLTSFTAPRGKVFQAVSQAGEAKVYAVVPIVDGELYLMSSWQADAQTYGTGLQVWSYLPTILMWLVALSVSGVAAHHLVTRHIKQLARAIGRFDSGDRHLQSVNMDGAPTELQHLGQAYAAMTESITRGEAELQDSLHQKEVLLREVHHRVKNNLQLIASIMNIHLRSARTAEAKELIKTLQDRIMSLATVHRGLYQTSRLADVRARELIPDIFRQIMALSSGAHRPFRTDLNIDDLRLVPDQAVPLALLLSEVLSNAIKHAGATPEHPGHVQVRLKRSGTTDAVIEVVNSCHVPQAVTTAAPGIGIGIGIGIGSQLITALVQQLGGRQDSGADGDTYRHRVTFPLAALADPEQRRAGAEV